MKANNVKYEEMKVHGSFTSSPSSKGNGRGGGGRREGAKNNNNRDKSGKKENGNDKPGKPPIFPARGHAFPVLQLAATTTALATVVPAATIKAIPPFFLPSWLPSFTYLYSRVYIKFL